MVQKNKLKRNTQAFAFSLMMVLSIFVIVPVQAETATTRPISDFVDEQGTYCIGGNPRDCFLFVPPVDNYIGWDNIRLDSNPPPRELIRLASVDYAALANAYIERASGGTVSLGTTTDGTIIERRLPDNRAEVTVLLRTRNALVYIVRPTADPDDIDFASGPLLFGVRAPDVLAGATPALGESFLQVVFINTAPGAELPDLEQLFFAPKPGQEPIYISFRVRADGELRTAFGVADGTPGRVEVVQTGLLMTALNTGYKGALEDGFPVELINLNVVGE